MPDRDSAAKDPQASADQLFELIKDVRFAMLTTRDAEGALRSRPMTTQNTRDDEDDALWFFASRSGDPVRELTLEPLVNVAYADPKKDTYVSVSGAAEVVEDPMRVERMWSKFAEAWFPGGPTNPDLALVRVRIHQADYWDISKPVQLFKMAKAAMTGKRPDNLGDHGHVKMN